MFRSSKSVQQVAALPFARRDAGFEVMLVTTRKGDRWVLPKGWPKRRESFAAAAMREAGEEAGVAGAIHSTPIGAFTYRKKMRRGYVVPAHVFVYALRVHESRETWREDGQRARQWVSLGDAADVVGDRDVARLLAELAEGDALHTVNAELDNVRDNAPDVRPNPC